ncbi:MAG: DNA translocase FtsK 4TM domain-containing protein, partial [Caulobacterales bacterium]
MSYNDAIDFDDEDDASTGSEAAGGVVPWRGYLASMGLAGGGLFSAAACFSYSTTDPSWNVASSGPVQNAMGGSGAVVADLLNQGLGVIAAPAALAVAGAGAWRFFAGPHLSQFIGWRAAAGMGGVVASSAFMSTLPVPASWPLAVGLGGIMGDGVSALLRWPLDAIGAPGAPIIVGALTGGAALAGLWSAIGLKWRDAVVAGAWAWRSAAWVESCLAAAFGKLAALQFKKKKAKSVAHDDDDDDDMFAGTASNRMRIDTSAPAAHQPAKRKAVDSVPVKAPAAAKPKKESAREAREAQMRLPLDKIKGFELPRLELLQKAKPRQNVVDEPALVQSARRLMAVLKEFGVEGTISQVSPGPVVTLYEFEPAAGVKSSRVITLADDIARSMSATSARVAVVPGRNAIGIELPNPKRETVYLRDLLASPVFDKSEAGLPIALGETIGGEPYIADLAKTPHLLVAGATGSGKSVGVNAMILSILYRLPPERCRFIMIDPKMLELSVYDGIPHLLAPVVTDPKKAVVALKWTVKEMEDRYRLMSKVGARNITGFNERVAAAAEAGETIERQVQKGNDLDTGEPIYVREVIPLDPMPFIVVVMDEMADLMLVAGKDVEGAVQRLAQMARAAGIHLIMATQRPSVDVITGTIKANFPTRISYQVASKIDSRTILGEQGAEQLLGQGDLLLMSSGSRVRRLHGPFVTDGEVEAVVKFLKSQGAPSYREEVIRDEDEGGGVGDSSEGGGSGDELFDRAVEIVRRDRRASTSYIQRRLQIGYNRAASLMEKLEEEGVVGPPDHAGR